MRKRRCHFHLIITRRSTLDFVCVLLLPDLLSLTAFLQISSKQRRKFQFKTNYVPGTGSWLMFTRHRTAMAGLLFLSIHRKTVKITHFKLGMHTVSEICRWHVNANSVQAYCCMQVWCCFGPNPSWFPYIRSFYFCENVQLERVSRKALQVLWHLEISLNKQML